MTKPGDKAAALELLERLRRLWLAAANQGDSYVQKFAEDVGTQHSHYWNSDDEPCPGGSACTHPTPPLSEKQKAFAEKQFKIFKV